MRYTLYICLLTLLAALPTQAQEVNSRSLPTDTLVSVSDSLCAPLLPEGVSTPALLPAAPGWSGLLSPYDTTDWRLHPGFNARFGLNISAAFGKYGPKGVGFGQTSAFAWSHPVNDRINFAAGLYAENLDWGRWHATSVGFAASLSYQLSETVRLYAYGSKAFFPRQNGISPAFSPFYWMTPKERLGAMAEFKLGGNALIQVSVETNTYTWPSTPAAQVHRH